MGGTLTPLDYAWATHNGHFSNSIKRRCFLIIGNTLRLATDNYRQEITILKLVRGKTPSFIGARFYIAVFYGFLGGWVAWFLVSILLLETASPTLLLVATYNYHYVIHGLSIKTGVSIILIAILMGLYAAPPGSSFIGT